MDADGRLAHRDDGLDLIRFERRLACSSERVWRALTDPAELRRWWGEARFEDGDFELRWLNSDEEGNTFVMDARITCRDPPRVLELSGDVDEGHGVLRFELHPAAAGGGTTLVFTSALALPAEFRAHTLAGWHYHLDALVGQLHGEPAELVDLPNERWHAIHAAYEEKLAEAGQNVAVPPAPGDDPRHATLAVLRGAVGRDGLDTILDGLLAEDVRWAGNWPGGACRSRADVQRTIREQVELGLRPRLRSLRLRADRVLLEIGLAPDSTLWMVLTLDTAGRVVELQDYSSEAGAEHDLALVAAGSAEEVPAMTVSGLVPLAHVADIDRSLAFYRLLGFESTATHEEEGRLVWAALGSERAALMLAQAGGAVAPGADAVFFYLYADDLRGLRENLVAHGITVGEIVDGTPGPREEMLVTDPDGYCLMVAQIEDDTVVAAGA